MRISHDCKAMSKVFPWQVLGFWARALNPKMVQDVGEQCLEFWFRCGRSRHSFLIRPLADTDPFFWSRFQD